jgi:acyl-CoA thioester hydrolase
VSANMNTFQYKSLISDMIITHRGIVYPWQCDHMGHMNVMWYVGKFDESSWQLLSAVGLTVERFKTEGFGMAAVEQRIEYKRELHAGDLITIRSRILEVGNKSLRLLHEMRHDASGELSAAMTTVGVCLDAETRRSRLLPDDVRKNAIFQTDRNENRNEQARLVSTANAGREEVDNSRTSEKAHASRNIVGEILEAMFCPTVETVS